MRDDTSTVGSQMADMDPLSTTGERELRGGQGQASSKRGRVLSDT